MTDATDLAPKSILDMTHEEARRFLLHPESYCSLDLPDYINFSEVLTETKKALESKRLSDMRECSPRDKARVNYTLFANKDGRHAWRPFQIIHPALYVSLVHAMTSEKAWKKILGRFRSFSEIEQAECLSIPIESQTRRSDRAEQVVRWWQGIEQRSIELSLEYHYVLHTDIADCYGSIYTHSIAWALHGRGKAKENRTNQSLLGNVIDRHIQDMREGQTNGIPQGSVLMDFVAEMVLGYADELLHERLKKRPKPNCIDYHILRYRDDYRVFVNSPELGETILRELTEVLAGLGLKLNGSKTSSAQPVIPSSLKPDKWAWLLHKQRDRNFQKHLLGIHAHGREHPNAGSLMNAMSAFHKRLMRTQEIQQPLPMIGIALDIACHGPRVFPACAAVISRLLQELDTEQRPDVLEKLLKRIHSLPKSGSMEVWLQRIS